MKVKRLYWAAGFLDGEGYFASARVGKSTPVVNATQISPQTLYWLKDIFGGSVTGPYKNSSRPHHQAAFRWQICGSNAIAVMFTVYSLLSDKRQAEIRKVVDIWKAAPGNPSTWRARGFCKNKHSLKGENYVVAPSGHGRCRQCGIESRRRYYEKHPDKWLEYARQQRERKRSKEDEILH